MKRLGLFTEASELLGELVPRVDDEQLPGVLVNLATVHIEAGEGDEAIRVLEPTVQRTAGSSLAWANLGQAYALVGRYEDAAAAFGRALLLAPQNSLVRVQLATIYMDHLGRIEEAWEALDAAFDSGHESREWFVRMLAASLLLDRHATVQSLLCAAKHNHSESFAEQLLTESVDLARQLADRYGGEPEEPDVSAGTSEPAAQDTEVGAEPAPVPPQDAPTPVPAQDGPGPDTDAAPGLPFLNLRYYGFFDFTIDYYQRSDAPDYVAGLFMQLRRAQRDPRFAIQGASMRGSPFSFTICPGCRIAVLTNRDAGKAIRCRMCNTTSPTTPIHGPDFDRILAEISAELDIEAIKDPQAPDTHLMFVQPPGASGDTVGEICRAAGMAELGRNNLISVHMLQEATTRRIFKPGCPWSVWTLPRSEPGAWARDSTPKALYPVIAALQLRAPGVMTLTTTMSAQQMAIMDKTVEEARAAAERTLRDALRSGEAQANELRQLAWLLDVRGEHHEAERMARAAIAADDNSAEGWEILGTALLRQEDFAAALDALEAALARDPTSVHALTMLARCYEGLGDDERARELYTRAMSRTGGELA